MPAPSSSKVNHNSTTYIIGHAKPDTDAVVAAISLSYLFDKSTCFDRRNPTPVITDPLNPETKYIFDKFSATTPSLISSKDISPKDQAVLVDHNETSQRLKNLNPDQVVEIIDHHKVNLTHATPIFLTFKPWGSTSTIIYFLMKQNSVKPTKKLAALMLSAILSDTIGFKSPTTTDIDKKSAKELAKLAEIKDIGSLTLEIFKAKSDVSKLSDEAMAKNDYKIFDFAQKVFINQIETVEQESIITRKAGLLKAIDTIKSQENVPLAFIVITDLLKVNSKIIVPDGDEVKIAERAFATKVTDNLIDIGPKISRKLDIAPAIETALQTS